MIAKPFFDWIQAVLEGSIEPLSNDGCVSGPIESSLQKGIRIGFLRKNDFKGTNIAYHTCIIFDTELNPIHTLAVVVVDVHESM
jgi:hypothetical protein